MFVGEAKGAIMDSERQNAALKSKRGLAMKIGRQRRSILSRSLENIHGSTDERHSKCTGLLV